MKIAKYNSRIQFKITEEEKKQFEDILTAAGMDMSEYFREIVKNVIKNKRV